MLVSRKKKTEINSIILKQMICTYKRVQLADKGFFERNLSTWLWSTGWFYNATAINPYQNHIYVAYM